MDYCSIPYWERFVASWVWRFNYFQIFIFLPLLSLLFLFFHPHFFFAISSLFFFCFFFFLLLLFFFLFFIPSFFIFLICSTLFMSLGWHSVGCLLRYSYALYFLWHSSAVQYRFLPLIISLFSSSVCVFSGASASYFPAKKKNKTTKSQILKLGL